MKILNTALLKLLVYLISGILAGFYYPGLIAPGTLVYLLPLLTCLLLLSIHGRGKGFFEFLIFSFFLFTGYRSVQPERNALRPLPVQGVEKAWLIDFQVLDHLKSTSYYDRYTATAALPNRQYSDLRILLRFSVNDPYCTPLFPGYHYRALVTIKDPPPPAVPEDFDYKRYLQKKGITCIANIHPSTLLNLDSTGSWRTFFYNLRLKLSDRMAEAGGDPFTHGLLNALILGNRELLDDDFNRQLTNAGGAHLMALSGLHVGMFTSVLALLLWPLRRLLYGRIIQFAVMLALLTGYVLLTGASPSVVRAAVMFAFLSAGVLLQRQTHGMNNLITSAFLLLLFRPLYLFDPGFQLSYAAVTGILLLHPICHRWWRPKNRILRMIWSLTCVSVAAQLFTAPVAIYYFHQFPGAFLATNILLTPFIFLLLISGYLIMAYCFFAPPPESLMSIPVFIASLTERTTQWLQAGDLLIEDIPETEALTTILIYLLLFFLIAGLRNPKYLLVVLSGILVLQGITAITGRPEPDESLVVFHRYGKSTIRVTTNQNLLLYNYPSGKESADNPILNTSGKTHATGEPEYLPFYFHLAGQDIFIIQDKGHYIPETGTSPICILIHSTTVNLDRMINTIQPSLIIADGSNYPSLVDYWARTCRQKNIPFHYTGEKGYFRLNSDP